MKKKLIISLLSLVLVLAVMLGMLPAASLTVHAATQVGGFDNYKFFNYSDDSRRYDYDKRMGYFSQCFQGRFSQKR